MTDAARSEDCSRCGFEARGRRPWHTAWCQNATTADWPAEILKGGRRGKRKGYAGKSAESISRDVSDISGTYNPARSPLLSCRSTSVEESFEQIAKNLATYWNDVDGNLPAWKEVPAEEKVAYLANFAGSMDVSYPRFEAGVHSMLEIAELNGYERDLGASVEDVCRAAYQEANGNPENRFPATPEEPSNPEPAMKLRDAINQDFFLLRAAAEGTKTPLDNYLNDSDHVDLDATLTYREHFELVGKLWNEATGISRNAQSELDTVKGEVMKLVDRLGNPEVEEVGYVRLWEQPVMAEEIEPEVPAIPQERAEAERMAQADQARQDERDRERAEDAWEMRETNEIKSLEDLMAKKLPKEPSREIDMEIER